jgi:hypothetical protein
MKLPVNTMGNQWFLTENLPEHFVIAFQNTGLKTAPFDRFLVPYYKMLTGQFNSYG